MNYLLSEIASITKGELVGEDNVVANIIFDSRNVFDYNKSLFVAIKGEMFDGHNFIEQLIEKGVNSFIVDKDYALKESLSVGYVRVDNPLEALQSLAAHHRRGLSYPIAAITGSNGKSIVKEWIYQLMVEKTIFRSPKSYNSQLGVALSMLMTLGHEDMAVIEAGISKKGEMKRLRNIIRPNIVIITNIGEAHGENFGSLSEKLDEKLELIQGCEKVIYNRDNTFVANQIEALTTPDKRFSWGVKDENDLVVRYGDNNSEIELNFAGKKYDIRLPMNDEASRENILHAVAFAALMGSDLNLICRRADVITPVAMRLELISGVGGAKIINDSYNSDYNSLNVALSYMKSIAVDGDKVVVLSDILQSGRENNALYKDVATLLNSCNVGRVIAIGEKAGVGIKDYFRGELECYATTDRFLKEIRPEQYYGKTILIKGSRVFEFEKISAKLEDKQHSTVMEVNIDALLNNYRYYRSKINHKTKMVAMVKAMSYGSGSYEIALTLQNSGIDYLAVAYIDEGVTLRKKGIYLPIITLNSNPGDFDEMIENRLEPEIYSIYSLNLFVDSCRRKGVKNYPIHIKLDTGMHRMGFEFDKMDDLRKLLDANDEVRVATIFSHFSCSDTPSQDEETYRQIAKYDEMSRKIVQKGTIRHLCNSAGIERFPEAHFDMVRLGLGLYGLSSVNQDKLQNVSTLHTRILQIKSVKRGDYVGYNMRGKVEQDMKIATLSIGYADGLDRKLGCGRWKMKIGTKYVPTVGNISMDTCSVDITGIDACEGDRVSVFSSAEDLCRMAELLETIPYEILTSVSTRIKRIYIRD